LCIGWCVMVNLNDLITAQTGRLLLLGNEAIVRGALEGGVKAATAYPGTPSSEIIDTFYKIARQTGVYAEYSTNEKVALEVAAGAAVSGLRSICSMKHVGLNVASDAFVTLAYTGVRAGLVIVTADDPSCWSSQNEQDNRYYARLANVPMFEPSNSQEAKEMTVSAFELSEHLELPILLRTTTRTNHTLSPVNLGPLKYGAVKGKFLKDAERFVMVPRNALKMHDVLLEKMKKALEISESSEYNSVTRNGEVGLITSGVAANYAAEAVEKLDLRASILKLGMTYPPPSKKILDFIKDHKQVFIIEELDPILENDVRSISASLDKRPEIYGKLTRHFPSSREYSTRIVYDGLAKVLGRTSFSEAVGQKPLEIVGTPARPPVLCPGCPHRASFYVLRTTLGKDVIYSTDIGCYALGIQPPLQIGDLLVCMGASLGTASGISLAQGEPAVAIVGDSTFFHASIPALINAVYNNHRILVLVLDNCTTAMTGFQPHPGVKSVKKNNVIIEDVARGCGVKFVKVVDPMNVQEARSTINEATRFQGPSLVVLRHICSIYERREGIRHRPYSVSEKDCNGCLACIKALGCPAFHIVDGKARIDEVLCMGCGFCVHICPSKSIEQSK